MAAIAAPPLARSAPSTRAGRWVDVRDGAALMAPLVVAYLPFALVIGTVVAGHGLPVGVVGTALIFGGSAQLVTARTLEAAGVAAAVLAGLVVNARLVVYSAALARRWGAQPRWFRLVAAALVVDPTWVVSERLAERCTDPARERRRFLGAAGTLAIGFTTTVAAGIVLGSRAGVADLEIAAPLCLLALVGPVLATPSSRRVALASALVAVCTATWPPGTGLLAATVAGALAGRPRREEPR